MNIETNDDAGSADGLTIDLTLVDGQSDTELMPTQTERALVDAVAAERAALGIVLARAHTVMLLQAGGGFDQLERGVRDLDLASTALQSSSTARERSASPVVGDVVDGRELVDRCPKNIKPLIEQMIAEQRQMIRELGVTRESIVKLADVAQDSISRRRVELDRQSSGLVTYSPT
ncbi:MAG: hypothetical protein GXP35_08450 [Actinobacteria bacterium]|nr:hypothetical protein [Actinomycetota bacterium]